MNKMVRLARALLVSSLCTLPSAQASIQANKTVFAPRTEAHQHGRHWITQRAFGESPVGNWGACVSADPFYFSSTEKQGLGKVFGGALQPNNTDAAGVVRVYASVDDTPVAGQLGIPGHAIVSENAPADALAGTYSLSPHVERWGAVVRVATSLDKYLNTKGFSVGVSVPVVQVKHNLGIKTLSSAPLAAGATGTPATATPLDVFTGAYSNAVATYAAATHAKWYAADKSVTNVGSVKVWGSYRLAEGKDGRVAVGAGLLMPTGTQRTAEFLMEPLSGAERHFGVSGSLQGAVRLWEKKSSDMTVSFSGFALYSYLFQAREVRTPGLATYGTTTPTALNGWSRGNAGAGLAPLVNFVTQPVYVTPGSHLEAAMGLSFEWKKFFVNVGYDLFYRQSETVRFVTQQKKPVADTAVVATPVLISLSTCTAPDAESHTLMIALGGSHQLKKCMVKASVGGSYELAGNNTKALSGVAAFGSVSVSF